MSRRYPPSASIVPLVTLRERIPGDIKSEYRIPCDDPKINPIATGERPVTDPEPAHPNPQLQRSRWTSLDGPWSFLCDDERKLLHPSEITRSDER